MNIEYTAYNNEYKWFIENQANSLFETNNNSIITQ